MRLSGKIPYDKDFKSFESNETMIYGEKIMVIKYIFYLLIGYLSLLVLLFLLQRKMLYFPDTQQVSEEYAARLGLQLWLSKDNFKGFVNKPSENNASGTIVVFHGNAGGAHDRCFYSDALSRRDFRVILAEYPGYGGRQGQPSEKILVDDACKTLEKAHEEYGDPLYVWGESLGAGVACAAVKQTSIPVTGVVLFLPWDSLADVAQTHYWYVPAKFLVQDKYDSIKNLENYKGRVAIVLAREDEVIPVKHGKRLYNALAVHEKRLWVFKDATHNQMPLAPELKWWDEVTSFIRSGCANSE